MTKTLTFTVRTYECDSYGHVNNAVYLQYLEYARWHYLKDIGFDYERVRKAGYGTYVAHIEIDYKRPALTDDVLTITSESVKKGAVSGTIHQVIMRGEETIAEAKVTWAFVDSSGRPVRIPPEFDVPGLYPEN
ncbi:MAG: acyl-CoA thioesterase [Spirochaetaceae bacterium]|jgi:acyl-CoA thioester hydrolase|nr:acyl-CoA thioesterase [Spirochaetaceae bacterium]